MKRFLSTLRRVLLFPMTLLIGTEGANPPAPTASTAAQTPPPAAAPPASAQEIADAVEAALDKRRARTDAAVIKDMATQHGLTVDELNSMLAQRKAEKDAQLPAEVQQQLDAATKRANDALIAAEVRTLCNEMNIIDADAAALLMSREGITVGDDFKVVGVKESLTELIEAKPFLVKQAQPTGGTGSLGNHQRGDGGMSYEQQLADARKRGDNTAATAIISAAAAAGINLR